MGIFQAAGGGTATGTPGSSELEVRRHPRKPDLLSAEHPAGNRGLGSAKALTSAGAIVREIRQKGAGCGFVSLTGLLSLRSEFHNVRIVFNTTQRTLNNRQRAGTIPCTVNWCLV